MSYTPSYVKPYPDGFKNEPIETTPITAEVMNGYDDAIENIENYLAEGEMGTVVIANPEIEGTEPNLTALQVGEEKFKIPSGGGTANVEWTQEVTSGTKIAEITIDDETTEVYAPSGNADAVILSKEEYDALPDTKLTDNKQYYVRDWSQGGGSGDYSYEISFEEFKTNKTYFGKDVYVRAYPFTTDIQTNGKSVTSSIVPNLSDIESFTDAYYMQNNTSAKTFSKLACYFTDANTLNIRSIFGISANANGILVLEYTRK